MLLKQLKDVTGVDTSNLAAKSNFIAWKGVAAKLDINKLVNVITGFNNLKKEVEDLDGDKLKTVPVDLKELCDVVSKEVVKKSEFNKLSSKVNKLENNIPDATILIPINQ